MGLPRRRISLRDAGIRAKLGLILVIPIVAIASLTVVRLADSGQRALSAQLVAGLAALSGDVADASHQLQRERMVAAEFLAGSAGSAVFVKQNELTNATTTVYKQHRQLGRLPAALKDRLDRIDRQLSTLDAMRQQVLNQQVSASEMVVRYGVIINEMVGYHSQIVQFATDSRLAASLRAVAAFAQAKAHAGDEQAIGYVLLKAGPLDRQGYTSFVATLTGQEAALATFDMNATPEQKDLVDSAITGDAVQQADQIGEQIRRSVGGAAAVRADDLSRVVGAVVDLMRFTEQKLDDAMAGDAKKLQTQVVREVVTESVLVLVAIALAIAVAFALARALSKSLSRLREGAMAVVGRELPNAVARLRDVREIGEITPDQIAEQIKDPVRIDSRDEIGQVAQAFNAVHREAVRVAAEQAALRTSVSAMFLSLARRSQALVDRMIGELDTIERTEEDPKRLARLFQLDHLATRMRRNDENLLVLAGADSGSPRRENALMADVLRAAQSEVEQYNRIEFGTVDLDVSVISHAVNDVVRLTAELLDNATRFSPPESAVVVEGRRIGDYVLIQIEDRGLGMAAEQLRTVNERLAEPPTVDATAFRMMGLAVVSRLASRYRIKVELRPNPEGGTITGITLPTGILVLPRLRGREPVIARPRQPLAVEAGPSGPASWPQLPGLVPASPGLATGVIIAPRPEPEAPDSRPTFSPPESRPTFGPPDSRPTFGPPESQPTFGPPESRPTFSPPVRPQRPTYEPPVRPEKPTFEVPLARPAEVRDYRELAQPYEPAVPPDTTEMPIFRSVEAAWFRGNEDPRANAAPPRVPSAPSYVPPAAVAPPVPPAAPPPVQPPPTSLPPRQRTGPDESWRTAADDGWRAAAAAAQPKDGGTTRSGLPKRVPAAQLVPGAVDTRSTTARTRRTPDEVRGLLSAYHRGVQRGRTGGEGSSLGPWPDIEEKH
jgi:signal transduction histidine kinase